MENGVWRTIRGRRVFIKDGEDLESAMKRSGKFKTKMNEMAVKGVKKEDLKEQYMTSLNNVSEMEYNGEITKDEYDQSIKNINDEYKSRRKDINGRETRAREIDNINKISKEEYDKTPKDYKGTLKELVDTAEFRGESKEKERQYWESKGYDVDKDKTILKYENGGTTLQPVKIEDSSPMSEWSDTTGTGLSDKQSSTLNKMSMTELRNMANEYDIDTKGKSKKQLLSALISMFNK